MPQFTRQREGGCGNTAAYGTEGRKGVDGNDEGRGTKGKEEGGGNCGTAALYRTEGKEGAAEIPQPTRLREKRERREDGRPRNKRLRIHAKRSVFARD